MAARPAFRFRTVLALVVALVCAPAVVMAQQFANLVADRVTVEGNSRLIAEGNIEILYGVTRLKAESIIFDRAANTFEIGGPITIIEGENAIIFADSAKLDPELQDGIMTSARMVLDQQLQLAAAELTRAGGRYTQLYKTVASSCQVCASNPVPLWQIRAQRVVHDQQEKQLYFYKAQFRVAGVPILYFPRLRLPDPTLKRATGFLIPRLTSTSQLGIGIKVPYFIAIGDHSDLTLTPYLSPKTRTLEFRYRRAFVAGEIEIKGAMTQDDLVSGKGRNYLFLKGGFDLPEQFRLNFDIRTVSDSSYLLDYGYGDQDRLPSLIEITRTRRNEYIRGAATVYRSLRASEDNALQPNNIIDGTYARRFSPGVIGGSGQLTFDLHGHQRHSRSLTDTDGDGLSDGLDLLRASARLDWQRRWTLQNGIQIAGLAEAGVDFYSIGQDPAYPATVGRTTRFGAVELRWPWVKTGASGASHVIEPIAQIVYGRTTGATVPNEDSRMVEFDEGNLFSLSRFPGYDTYETGLRTNIGLGYTRFDPAGWSLGVTLGRILREATSTQFTDGSGVGGKSSDWMAALQFNTGERVSLLNRAVFSSDFDITKNETRLSWTGDRVDLATGYIWMKAEPLEYRPTDTSEWTMDATYQMTRQWQGAINWRYDIIADRATSAGLGLQYRNECAKVDLSLSRRFTTSTSVSPSTRIGLQVELSGFGTGGDSSAYARSCVR